MTGHSDRARLDDALDRRQAALIADNSERHAMHLRALAAALADQDHSPETVRQTLGVLRSSYDAARQEVARQRRLERAG